VSAKAGTAARTPATMMARACRADMAHPDRKQIGPAWVAGSRIRNHIRTDTGWADVEKLPSRLVYRAEASQKYLSLLTAQSGRGRGRGANRRPGCALGSVGGCWPVAMLGKPRQCRSPGRPPCFRLPGTAAKALSANGSAGRNAGLPFPNDPKPSGNIHGLTPSSDIKP
jgi:hypothetical protein